MDILYIRMSFPNIKDTLGFQGWVWVEYDTNKYLETF